MFISAQDEITKFVETFMAYLYTEREKTRTISTARYFCWKLKRKAYANHVVRISFSLWNENFFNSSFISNIFSIYLFPLRNISTKMQIRFPLYILMQIFLSLALETILNACYKTFFLIFSLFREKKVIFLCSVDSCGEFFGEWKKREKNVHKMLPHFAVLCRRIDLKQRMLAALQSSQFLRCFSELNEK